MCNGTIQNLILCFTVILTAVAFSFSQIPDSFDIPTLLGEVKQASDNNWRRVGTEYPNYSYKWSKVWRKADKNGRVKEESELYELFTPIKCPIKNCRRVNVLLAKDGKPVAAEKIEKQRIEAGKKLERMETDSQAQILTPDPTGPLYWMTFGYWIRRPFSDQELVVWIDGREILEKCEFFAPSRELINGRQTISLSFRPRTDAAFNEKTKYMSQVEGKIWIDAADKVLIRLAAWQKGTKFAENAASDYLFARAALARDLIRTEEGFWFPRLGRINGLDYPNLFAEMKVDFSVENFDYHRFKTEIKSVEIK